MSSSAGNSARLIHLVAYKNSLSDPKEAGIMMEMFGDHCERFRRIIDQTTGNFYLIFIVA